MNDEDLLAAVRVAIEKDRALRQEQAELSEIRARGDSLPEKSGLFPDRQTTANMLFSRTNAQPPERGSFPFSEDFSRLPAGNLGEA